MFHSRDQAPRGGRRRRPPTALPRSRAGRGGCAIQHRRLTLVGAREIREDDPRPLALVGAVQMNQDGRERLEGDGVDERPGVERLAGRGRARGRGPSPSRARRRRRRARRIRWRATGRPGASRSRDGASATTGVEGPSSAWASSAAAWPAGSCTRLTFGGLSGTVTSTSTLPADGLRDGAERVAVGLVRDGEHDDLALARGPGVVSALDRQAARPRARRRGPAPSPRRASRGRWCARRVPSARASPLPCLPVPPTIPMPHLASPPTGSP